MEKSKGLTSDLFSIKKRLRKHRGKCAKFFRNINVMWAGNALSNDLLEIKDLQDFLLNSDSLKKSYSDFEKGFDNNFHSNHGMTSSILRAFKGPISKIILLVFGFKIFDVVLVYIMYCLSKYLEEKEAKSEIPNFITITLLFGTICISDFYKTVLSSYSDFKNNEVGHNIKGLAMVKIFQKVLKISLKSNKNVSEGELIDYIQTDCSNYQ